MKPIRTEEGMAVMSTSDADRELLGILDHAAKAMTTVDPSLEIRPDAQRFLMGALSSGSEEILKEDRSRVRVFGAAVQVFASAAASVERKQYAVAGGSDFGVESEGPIVIDGAVLTLMSLPWPFGK
jgi:hypothetical protein